MTMNDEGKPQLEEDGKAQLRSKLTAIATQMEGGDFNGVRAELFAGRWAKDIHAGDLPAEVLRSAIALTDSVQASLMRWPPDIPGAQASLAAARKLLD